MMRGCLITTLFLMTLCWSAPVGIVDQIRATLERGDFAAASASLDSYRRAHGNTPDALEAMSWIARAELSHGDTASAERWAQQTYQFAVAAIKKRPLDRDPNAPLALALGAAIEVEGNIKERAKRMDGVAYLREQLRLFSGTSIAERIQKNINLLSLVGHPAPALQGAALPKGKPVLLFFWAHWCPDCKAEADVLRRAKAEFASKGLTLIAPTQLYGYAAGGEDAKPQVEMRYIEQIRQRYYAGVVDGPAIVNAANFRVYGASTTPTLVLVDRNGIVRMYHPGALSYLVLWAEIRAIL